MIPVEPLSARAFAPYGAVLSADRDDLSARGANQGTAARRDHLADLTNPRPGARLNLASFRCTPRDLSTFRVSLLERHPFSPQVFVPMNASRYLVVVALGDDAPDLDTLRAFEALGTQGVAYAQGVWHHPLIALDAPTDFTCLVWEDGGPDDCVEHPLSIALALRVR